MDLFSILASCAALSAQPNASEKIESSECESARSKYQLSLKAISLSARDRDAITRVALAEASNQGDSGLAAVVYTIINRLISGAWGDTVAGVVNAPRQFEPVHKVGGWERLDVPTAAQRAKIDTIINLALDSRLPDLTNGALFFQNPDIVAKRELKGQVSNGLTHFGGSQPTVVIKDHAFYASINQGGAGSVRQNSSVLLHTQQDTWDVYGNAGLLAEKRPWDAFSSK